MRYTFTSASGSTTVPMSRPSSTTVPPPEASRRCSPTRLTRTSGTAETAETPAVTRALASAMGYLGPAGQVVAAARDVPLPDLDLTLPATPQNPDAFARLSTELNLGGAAERILKAMASTAR